jgi:protein-disulfide isomerase
MTNTTQSSSGWWGRIRAVLDVVATIAMLVAAGAIVWAVTRGPSSGPGAPATPPVPTEPVSLEGAPVLGDPAARVVLIEFSDFECPFCGRFANDVLPAIKTKYVEIGRVQMAFRHFPLNAIHPRATPAAVAAVCAQQQERFWEFHDLLFQDVKKLTDEDMEAYADTLSLDIAAFNACREKDGHASTRVSADLTQATALGLRGTPALLVGTLGEDGQVRVAEVIAGAPNAERLAAAFDALMTR